MIDMLKAELVSCVLGSAQRVAICVHDCDAPDNDLVHSAVIFASTIVMRLIMI
jgi:hypothetical protein